MLMVCEGAYRGFGDTLTPLPVTFLVALVNLILDPLLIFGGRGGGRGLGWGVAGAAWATVIAQYVGIAAYLCLLFGKGKTSPLYKKEGGKVMVVPVVVREKRRWREEEEKEDLEERRRRRGQRQVMEQQQQASITESNTSNTTSSSSQVKPSPSLLPSFLSTALPTFLQLLSANGAMLIRNGTLMLVWAYATATATRMSTLDVAAHQVALSIWLFFALISEAPGIAAQVMAARLYSTRNLTALRSLARRLTSLGLTLGLGLGGALLVLRRSLPPLFASDPLVLGKVGELMVLLGLQLPLVALTLIGESFLVGCGKFAALAMCSTLTSGVCALVLRWLGQGGGGGGGVVKIWWAIKGLFVMRLACVAWLLYNPWKGTLSGREGWRKGGREEEVLLMIE
jgi:Na+-driven multidrug efflux pump